RSRFSLQEMNLLGLFASQAAVALHLLRTARRARSLLVDAGGDVAVVARLAAVVDALEGGRREAGIRLLGELEGLLGPCNSPGLPLWPGLRSLSVLDLVLDLAQEPVSLDVGRVRVVLGRLLVVRLGRHVPLDVRLLVLRSQNLLALVRHARSPPRLE